MPGIINRAIDICYYNKFAFTLIILRDARIFEMMTAAVKLGHFFIKNT